MGNKEIKDLGDEGQYKSGRIYANLVSVVFRNIRVEI